ncbi:unnamed protein product [Effrenium voratum]|uniref:Uncharacterized protein n=1 Tax=Effrenium voratum TaxID=2562239 RepID=A0AA36JFS7_9DINO|nr:unnamed protein product [Effrenium voratum]CAJ1422434.1 unnamed protein product [Effrenium voratum]
MAGACRSPLPAPSGPRAPAAMARILVDGEARALAAVDAEQTEGLELEEKDSLAEAFAERFQKFARRPCLGWRGRAGVSYKWMSYGQFFSETRKIASALSASLPPGSLIGICGANSLAWFQADFACLWAGFGTVPLSDTWDVNTLELALERCEVGAVFCDAEHVAKLRELRPRWLILLDSADLPSGALQMLLKLREVTGSEVDVGQLPALLGDVDLGGLPSSGSVARQQLEEWVVAHFVDQIHSFGDFAELPIQARDREAIHTILHTSGTTGLPKGVVYSDGLWHKNMVRYAGMNIGYSYMPLAYITDRHTVCTSFWNGGRVGIRSPGSTDEIFRDLVAVRPTVLKGVPAFFERVHSAAQLVQDKTLNLLGGRCQLLICGAGALDKTVGEWFRSCTTQDGKQVAFLEMYGGTECGNLAVNRKLNPTVEYKLLPYGDMPSNCGELVVKTGAAMFSCYYKDTARTAASFTEDGFYKIGDIVRIEEDQIEVIGRAKTSIKLSMGKWVFPESLETLFRAAVSKDGVRHVWVHGDSQHDSLIAVLDADGKEPAPLLQKLNDAASANGLQAYERIASVLLATGPFSQEAGTLNGTGKLDRGKLLKIYGADLAREFQRLASEAANTSLEQLDGDQSFRAQGGTSLKAAHIAQLYVDLGVPLSRAVQLLLSDEPVRRVVTELSKADPLADAQLDLPAVTSTNAKGRTLLTGATGFLGRFILAEMLEQRREVICLVRAETELAAKQRLSKGLMEIGRWHNEWWDDLHVVLGSLAKPLEISNVSDILHVAAMVDLSGTYGAHRSANVLGTLNVLQLAAQAGARLVFVSTTDTYKDKTQATACKAEPPQEVLADAQHGYAVSKAVGEALVARAIQGGLSSCTARLGMVAGDSRTGFCNPTDFGMRLLISFAHTQSFPETGEQHAMVQSLPVNVAAAALVDLLDASEVGAVNIVAGRRVAMAELRQQLLRFGGPFQELPLLPFPRWMAKAKAEARLSAWPVLGWAAALPEFPVFNAQLPDVAPPSWARPRTAAGVLAQDAPLPVRLGHKAGAIACFSRCSPRMCAPSRGRAWQKGCTPLPVLYRRALAAGGLLA